eukprot:g4318.t1
MTKKEDSKLKAALTFLVGNSNVAMKVLKWTLFFITFIILFQWGYSDDSPLALKAEHSVRAQASNSSKNLQCGNFSSQLDAGFASCYTNFTCGNYSNNGGYFDYFAAYKCSGDSVYVFVAWVVWLVILFYLLGDTADTFFIPTLEYLVEGLKISPSVAGVTFLSFGNGSPDVFSSVIAVLKGVPDMSLGALLGAGLFVTSVVVGSVCFTAAEQSVPSVNLLRDITFYMIALVYIFVIAHQDYVSPMMAFGFLILYGFYVAIVLLQECFRKKTEEEIKDTNDDALLAPLNITFSADQNSVRDRAASYGTVQHISRRPSLKMLTRSGRPKNTLMNSGILDSSGLPKQSHSSFSIQGLHDEHVTAKKRWVKQLLTFVEVKEKKVLMATQTEPNTPNSSFANATEFDMSALTKKLDDVEKQDEEKQEHYGTKGWAQTLSNIAMGASEVVEIPLWIIRRLTIPLVDEDTWNKYYTSSSFTFGSLMMAGVAFDVVGFVGFGIILAFGLLTSAFFYWNTDVNNPPASRGMKLFSVGFAFLTSVVWIAAIANELVGMLQFFSIELHTGTTFMGAVVLAIANSLGDLVADTAIAREGLPSMALAATFSGPMFNALMGLGLSLTIEVVKSGGKNVPRLLEPDGRIVVILSFYLLMASLLFSIVGFSMSGFKLKRTHAALLIFIYIFYVANILVFAATHHKIYMNLPW